MFKLVREFAKEVRRLEKKYECTCKVTEGKTLDELTDMWINDFFELYFIDDHYEAIKECGPKQYAQYYLNIRGVVPKSEVTMWK